MQNVHVLYKQDDILLGTYVEIFKWNRRKVNVHESVCIWHPATSEEVLQA